MGNENSSMCSCYNNDEEKKNEEKNMTNNTIQHKYE
jgi:hypothetical protein